MADARVLDVDEDLIGTRLLDGDPLVDDSWRERMLAMNEWMRRRDWKFGGVKAYVHRSFRRPAPTAQRGYRCCP